MNTSIKCTSTGIFSNRPPVLGTPVISDTNTLKIVAPGSESHRLGLLATAKREAAKRGLYSKFFRGPVLGPDTLIEKEKHFAALVSQTFLAHNSIAETVSIKEVTEVQSIDETVPVDLEVSKSLKKKQKSRETKESGIEDKDEEARRERKRRRKESHATEKRHKKEKYKGETNDTGANSSTLARSSPAPISQKDQTEGASVIEKNKFPQSVKHDHESQADRKRRKKEEKKRLKEFERVQAKDTEKIHSNHGSKPLATKSCGNQTKLEEICSVTTREVLDEPKKRKKRKYAEAE